MEYRRLGKSGLKVSALSFGSWITFGNQVEDSSSKELMKIAYENGVNFFDNAELYADGQSEVVMGDILKKMGWGRDTYVVSSKVFWGGKKPNQYGLSRKHVMEACHASLKRLQVDYLDLYFCHRADRETPVEETVAAMTDLVRQGKILYWGTSEWDAGSIMEAYGIARQYNMVPPAMEQPQYNMFFRDRVELEYRHLYSRIGLGTTIWSPLASGFLTGKYNNGIPEGSRMSLPDLQWLRDVLNSETGRQRIEKVKLIAELAGDLEITIAQLAIAWCLRNPNVSTVILGATKAKQLIENLKAMEATGMITAEVEEKLEQILGNKPKFPLYG